MHSMPTVRFHFSPDEEACMGLSHKDPRAMSADEFIAGLKPISDDDIYLKVPSDRSITMAAETLDPKSVFIKSPSYKWFPVSE